MTLVINRQEIEIDGIGSIEVSPILPNADLTQSSYLRLVQFYIDPPMTTNRRPVLTIYCYGGNQQSSDTSALQIAVPPDTF